MLVRFLTSMLIGEDASKEEEDALASGVLCPTVTLPSLLVRGVLVPLVFAGSSSIVPPTGRAAVAVDLLPEALASGFRVEVLLPLCGELLNPSCF